LSLSISLCGARCQKGNRTLQPSTKYITISTIVIIFFILLSDTMSVAR